MLGFLPGSEVPEISPISIQDSSPADTTLTNPWIYDGTYLYVRLTKSPCTPRPATPPAGHPWHLWQGRSECRLRDYRRFSLPWRDLRGNLSWSCHGDKVQARLEVGGRDPWRDLSMDLRSSLL